LEEGVNITASELCNAALAKYRNLFETEKWKLITVALSANESKEKEDPKFIPSAVTVKGHSKQIINHQIVMICSF
jgi:hypothetical protein